MTHLTRAQPEEAVSEGDAKSAEVRNRMIRYPLWLDALIKEAADKEGLSANAWIARCLAEGAKRSNLYGWATSSLNHDPKPPEGRAPLGGRVAAAAEVIAREGKLTLHSGTYPTPENTVTWSRLVTGEPEFVTPDDDIPSL